MKFKEKAVNKWKTNHTWQPLLIAIAIILIIAISHKTYWEITTETNPSNIWDSRNTLNDENLTIIQYGSGELVNQTVTFKGVLEIFPYTNISIGPLEKANGTFDPDDGVVFSEEIYTKNMIRLNGGIKFLDIMEVFSV